MKKIIILIFLLITGILSGEVQDEFIENLTQGRYQKAELMFSDEVSQMIQTGKLQKVWESLLQSTGDFEYILSTSEKEYKDFTGYIVTTKFQNTYMELVISVNQQDEIAGLFFRPSSYTSSMAKKAEYVALDKLIEEEVEFNCNGYNIKGTMTVPRGKRAYPIVIMATGSGPNDRDETIGANHPFKNLAQGLATQGIASLRYDKRTLTYPQIINEIPEFNPDNEYTEEIKEAFTYVSKEHKGRNIYYLGHSMGGYMLPRVMNEIKGFSGGIMISANARSLSEIIMEQVEYIMSIDNKAHTEAEILLIEKRYQRTKRVTSADVDIKGDLLLGLSKYYWSWLNNYRPLDLVSEIATPLLVIQGDRDYQVNKTDYEIWQKQLQKNKSVVFHSYSDLNHLLMVGEGKSVPSEYLQPGVVAEKVIRDILIFIADIERINGDK